jgi:hypothetical protein
MANVADPGTFFAAIASHCAPVVLGQEPLFVSLFLTGMVGSITHCTAMCGPFVMLQVSARLSGQLPGPAADLTRLAGAALLPYQFGRFTTYAVLGAVISLPFGFDIVTEHLWWVTPVMLSVIAGMLLIQAFPMIAAMAAERALTVSDVRGKCSRVTTIRDRKWAGLLTQRLAGFAKPLFRQPVGWRGYILGLMLGFLPCGLLYAALALAASSHQPSTAAIGMLSFAFGTLPISWLIGYGSMATAARWRDKVHQVLPFLVVANAILVLLLAYRSL